MHFVPHVLTYCADVGQQLDLQLFGLPTDSPSAFPTPGPGVKLHDEQYWFLHDVIILKVVGTEN